jgi:hypothetical protein
MTTKTTTSEENIAIMRRFVAEVQEKGDPSLIDELIHPKTITHPKDPRQMIVMHPEQ